MSKYKLDNVSFGTLEDKQIYLLGGVIDILNYIGEETKLSNTEKELKKLAIKHLKKISKTIKK